LKEDVLDTNFCFIKAAGQKFKINYWPLFFYFYRN